MNKMLCFDLDGTLVDLYSVNNWLEKLKASDPTPYLIAKPLYDMKLVIEAVNQLIKKG